MSTTDIATRVDRIHNAQKFAGAPKHYFPHASEVEAYEVMRQAQIAADFAEHAAKPLASSARSCAADAERSFNAGNWSACTGRALDSLAFSAGMFSERYANALELASKAVRS